MTYLSLRNHANPYLMEEKKKKKLFETSKRLDTAIRFSKILHKNEKELHIKGLISHYSSHWEFSQQLEWEEDQAQGA